MVYVYVTCCLEAAFVFCRFEGSQFPIVLKAAWCWRVKQSRSGFRCSFNVSMLWGDAKLSHGLARKAARLSKSKIGSVCVYLPQHDLASSFC